MILSNPCVTTIIDIALSVTMSHARYFENSYDWSQWFEIVKALVCYARKEMSSQRLMHVIYTGYSMRFYTMHSIMVICSLCKTLLWHWRSTQFCIMCHYICKYMCNPKIIRSYFVTKIRLVYISIIFRCHSTTLIVNVEPWTLHVLSRFE